jgi:hypothetical protein
LHFFEGVPNREQDDDYQSIHRSSACLHQLDGHSALCPE